MLHNNEHTDIAPFELDKEPDMSSMSFIDGYGFICTSHMSRTHDG